MTKSPTSITDEVMNSSWGDADFDAILDTCALNDVSSSVPKKEGHGHCSSTSPTNRHSSSSSTRKPPQRRQRPPTSSSNSSTRSRKPTRNSSSVRSASPSAGYRFAPIEGSNEEPKESTSTPTRRTRPTLMQTFSSPGALSRLRAKFASQSMADSPSRKSVDDSSCCEEKQSQKPSSLVLNHRSPGALSRFRPVRSHNNSRATTVRPSRISAPPLFTSN